MAESKKPMKLPNGFGSAYKLSGRRRRPWVARKTKGWNEKGQPVYVYIGYYETKKEALAALAMAPDDVTENATVQEVHDAWWAAEGVKMKESSARLYLFSYNQMEDFHKKQIDAITIRQLELLLQSLPSFSAVRRMKLYLVQIYEFAFYRGYVTADQNERAKRLDINIKAVNERPHDRFSPEELEKIKAAGLSWVLVMIYSGCRIGELLALAPEDIHLKEKYFSVTDAKTPSGIRDVPIADAVLPYWEGGKPREFCCSYKGFLAKWKACMSSVGLAGHTPHDTRHTCASLLEGALVDDRVVKSILGHKRSDITGLYSHIDIAVKLEAINKICL